MNLFTGAEVYHSREGVRQLIDQYIQRYGKRLYGLCRSLCPNRFDADDLYQETWLKVVKNISKYDPERDFEPWLTHICVNTYRSALRRLARSPLLDFSNAEDQERLLGSIPAPEQKDYSPLYEAVAALPDKLRLTVALFYFQDMDLKSTAQALGIPAGTVKSRLNKARSLLKEALAHETDL